MARYRDSGILMLLGAIWGFSYIFIRVAVPAFGPIGLSLARVAIGAVGLMAWAAMRGLLGDVPRLNRTFFILATLNALIPYTLIAFAELHISASLAAILNSTTPPITALLVVFINHEQIGRGRAVGLALGMAGVGVLVGWSPIPFSGVVVLAVIAMIVASGSYGLAGIYAKRSLSGTSSFSMAVGQQMAATTLLLPIGLGAMAVGECGQTDVQSRNLGNRGVGTGLHIICLFALFPSHHARRTGADHFRDISDPDVWAALGMALSR